MPEQGNVAVYVTNDGMEKDKKRSSMKREKTHYWKKLK